MNVGELLSELRSGMLRDASTLKSGPPDQFWADENLIRYINEAQRRFARRSFCLRDDTTPEVTQVTLSSGVSIYQLHESVLRVQSARHQDATTDLIRITHSVNFVVVNDAVEFQDGVTSLANNIPVRFATDEGLQLDDQHQVRLLVDPVPDSSQAGKIIYLRVIRLPIDDLTLDATDAAPEIPEDWHLDMLEWAAYRALRNWDLDAEDRRKAEQHKSRFEEAVIECRKEVEQEKMFEPVLWAFGQNGFGGYTR